MKVLINNKCSRALEVAAIVSFKDNKYPSYYVLFADFGYYLADLNECTIVDYSYRKEWKFIDNNSTLDQRIESFDEMYNNVDFLEKLIDGDQYTEDLFEDKRRLYAGPNITTGNWLGFNYPMGNEMLSDINALFRYEYPRTIQAQNKREELKRLIKEINLSSQSQLRNVSQRDLFAFHLSIQLDEVGIAMYLLRKTGVSSHINHPSKHEGKIFPPPLALALENISLDATKLLLGYGAIPTQSMISNNDAGDQITNLLSMKVEDLYANIN